MARDFLPAVYANTAATTTADEENDIMLFNCLVWPRDNGGWAVFPRAEMTNSAVFTPASADDRGRGVTYFQNRPRLYLDQDTYYYSGGNQDLTVTSSPGYAGNTGFNEDYLASFLRHKVSGSENLIIVNAGHTSTNASAKHGNLWYVADGDTAPSSVSDADMPGNNGVSITRGGASMDGYLFLCDIAGQIHNSDLNDITAWTDTNFLTAEREPDVGIYIGKHQNNIFYIGTQSVEFFYNAGNATGSPLSRRQDISYRIGCVTPNTVSERGDVVRFLGKERNGKSGVYEMRNFQLRKISNTQIDDFIRNRLNLNDITTDISGNVDTLTTDVYGVDVLINGRFGYLLTISIHGTFFYDDEAGVWSNLRVDSSETYKGNVASWPSCLPIVSFNQYSSPDSSASSASLQLTNGRLVHFTGGDDDDPNDLASLGEYERFINFGRWDGGTDKKKRVTSVRVLSDVLATTSRADLTGQLKWTKYGQSDVVANKRATTFDFTASRLLNLNARGASVYRIGSGREFRFALEFTLGHGPISFVKGLEIEYDIVE